MVSGTNGILQIILVLKKLHHGVQKVILNLNLQSKFKMLMMLGKQFSLTFLQNLL
jgi:hypothetical protein